MLFMHYALSVRLSIHLSVLFLNMPTYRCADVPYNWWQTISETLADSQQQAGYVILCTTVSTLLTESVTTGIFPINGVHR